LFIEDFSQMPGDLLRAPQGKILAPPPPQVEIAKSNALSKQTSNKHQTNIASAADFVSNKQRDVI
jgi:hypothetical protein